MSDRTAMSTPAGQAYQVVSWVEPSADQTITNRPTQRLPGTEKQSLDITNPGIVHTQLHYYQWLPATAPTATPPATLQPSPRDTYMAPGYPQSRPPPGPQRRSPDTDTTRNPQPSLPPVIQPMKILSSERYDDGVIAARRSPRKQEPHSMISVFGLIKDQNDVTTERKTGQTSQRPHDGELQAGPERQRKKQKLSSEDEGDDEAAKKARGRPRLDTKDETAADRRRTQIRMAQRAYRHRKETTIASLEKQVQDLRSANEQMSSIFINFHDYAVGKGLLRGDPEFGNHLKSTTEQFLALVKSVSSDDNGKDEEGTSADGSKQGHSDADADQVNRSEKAPTIAPQPAAPESSISAPWGGYEVSHEPIIEELGNQIDWDSQQYMAPPPRQDLQVISRATFDNASFGFDVLDFDNLQQYHAEVPDDYQNLVAFQESLPLTKSLAQHETTFGRHLQRAALERGWRLISAKNPNPTRLNQVFGFCLRFETRDTIMSRLKSSLETSSKDPLFDWRAPFVHLGGSGTYYPLDEDMSGTMAPKFRTGMSMGPFSPSVVNTRQTAMIDDFRINLPGFEGEFFDSNDVEGYLRGRGVNIPPNVEFVTVNLDLLNVRDSPSPNSESNKLYSPPTPKSPDVRLTDLTSQNEKLASQIEEYARRSNSNQIKDLDMNFSTIAFPEWSSALEQKQLSGNLANNNPFDLTGPIFNAVPVPQNAMVTATGTERPFHEGHLVTLSVTVLVEEILSHATCLGRAPGFRPADVEAALRRALRQAF